MFLLKVTFERVLSVATRWLRIAWARAALVDQFPTGPIYNTHSQLRISLAGDNDIEDESDNELQEGNGEFDVEWDDGSMGSYDDVDQRWS
jgi:hypothetical protein